MTQPPLRSQTALHHIQKIIKPGQISDLKDIGAQSVPNVNADAPFSRFPHVCLAARE
tara:strand:- start:423 stop:593 length:171 start_codon:yes stop_codon:yes gene_type:complete